MALLIVAFAIALSLLACNQPATFASTPPIVKVTELAPEVSTTPIVCTDNPSGLTLDVKTGGFHQVRVAGQGFKPGESLLFVFTAQSAAHRVRQEARPIQGVNADGTFSWDETLTPPSGSQGSAVIWNIAVVHSRGVACTTVQVL
jgi:hypothetical protein